MPVPGRLSAALLEWKALQEKIKGRRIMAARRNRLRGVAVCVGRDLREIQELLRHKNIRTTVRYTHVGYEQTRQTAEALIDALERKRCGGDDSSRAQ